MRIARSLFILAIAGVIFSVVKDVNATKRPLEDSHDPLTDEVMEELERLKLQVSRGVGDSLTNEMASLQLIHQGSAVPPIPSPHQASVSQMEIDGEVNQETLEPGHLKDRQKTEAWLNTLLSEVCKYEELLAREANKSSQEMFSKRRVVRANSTGTLSRGQSHKD